MTFGLTPQGFKSKRLADIKADLEKILFIFLSSNI